jgi:ATP-dependent Clp protease ATP-binding subunit ClpC
MQSHRSHRIKDVEEQERKSREFAKTRVHYSGQLLSASLSIPSISDFAESLLVLDRFDDVINLAKYVTGEVNAHDLGWPGLISSKELYSDIVGEMVSVAMDAFFLSKRYAEGCRWIYDRVIKGEQTNDKYAYYQWFLLGQALSWLGYPEETARVWVIAVRKGYSANDLGVDGTFEQLCNLALDNGYPEKEEIYHCLLKAETLITSDKTEIFEQFKQQAHQALEIPEEEMPALSFMENQLGIKMPLKKTQNRMIRYNRLTVSPKKSSDPIVKEVIALINKNVSVPKSGSTATSNQHGKQREKVTVDGSSTVRSGNTLEQFGVDLTEQAATCDMAPVIGRDREIERMMRILSRAEKNNPVLLGEAGVGKTAVVQGLAQKIVQGDVPDSLKGRKIIELNVGVLVAGTTYRGDFEKRMNDIVKETSDNPNIILFIDELHTLMGSGDSRNGLDGSNILKPALAAGRLRLIGATTPGEFSRSIEKDPAMERRFSPVWLSEIDRTMTRAVLDARKILWEKHHSVSIDDDAFDAAIQLTDQHIRHRHFPDKAIDAIDEACALARTMSNTQDLANRVTRGHVTQVIDTWSGRNEQPTETGGSLLAQIRQGLGERVIGHEGILDQLAKVAADEKLGLRLSTLPRILCFAGHSQCGKTETAGAMAQALWPDESDRFLFVNMAQLSGAHDLYRLTGAPRNYADSDVCGVLPMHLKQHPHSIIFLYQFTKAHPQVKRFLGNLFAEGCFPDPDGRTVYTGSAIFILSATCEDTPATFGFGPGTSGRGELKTPDIKEMLKQLETPESIINALSDTFWFDSLSESQVLQIIEQRLSKAVNQPGIRELKVTIDRELSSSLSREFLKAPVSSRNLRTLLNRKAYSAIAEALKNSD